MAELTIAEVARIAEGELERGDGARTVRGVAPLDEARARVEVPGEMALIRVDDPRRALTRIL
ncbi:MAG TPA: hypothetical protein VM759_02090, partial [Longimicrobium sp.]|nr:hypothetical protein [Longimicrobium sp.]